MKRASAGGLIVALLVLTGFGVAGSGVPLKACRSCDGLAVYQSSRYWRSNTNRPPPRIGCPDCADRGKVSLFRSWMRPGVSSGIAAVLRGLKDPQGLDVRRALRLVVQESGPAYTGFLAQALPNNDYFHGAAFAEAETKHYLLLFADSGPGIIPGSAGLLVLLLSAEGRALDFVEVSCSIYEGGLREQILPEDAQIVIHRRSEGPRDQELALRLHRWNDTVRELKVRGSDVCRFRIQGERLELIEK